MKAPPRGEVWLVDRAIVTLIPHTTSVRGSRFEVAVPVRFLKTGAFDAQGLVTVPVAWLIRRVGTLTLSQIKLLESAVCYWLGIKSSV